MKYSQSICWEVVALSKFSRFWSGRCTGLPCSLIVGGIAAYERLGDHLWTALTSRNFRVFGDRSVVQRGVIIRNPGQISIGRDVNIGRRVRMSSEIPAGLLNIGDEVRIDQQCTLDFSGNLSIGDQVMISQGCMILSHDHGLDPFSVPVAMPVRIEKGAWLGSRAIILPSTKRIGVGAIVGAGAVVTKEVPDGAIVVGNPARILHRSTLPGSLKSLNDKSTVN